MTPIFKAHAFARDYLAKNQVKQISPSIRREVRRTLVLLLRDDYRPELLDLALVHLDAILAGTNPAYDLFDDQHALVP